MIGTRLKAPLRRIKQVLIERRNARHVRRTLAERQGWQVGDFDFDEIANRTEAFIEDLCTETNGVRFRYAANIEAPTLYASAYACMTLSLAGRMARIDTARKQAWIEYFDAHQSPQDGLFRDPAVANELFDQADWWGARHLALHMISAYTVLGGQPRHPFGFLAPYYDPDVLKNWLDDHDWDDPSIGTGDFDNQIMNIGCLLQYQRDAWHDEKAAAAVEQMKTHLLAHRHKATGLWGGFDIDDPEQRSRMVQFAYHLLPLFFYDGYVEFDHEKIANLVLRTQNEVGGYGVKINASACEDIDSIDLLIRLSPHVSSDTRVRISASIGRALGWVCANQVADGGFVFRLNEAFEYGSRNTSSRANQGAMLPTWFRLLSIVYMANYLSIEIAGRITPCPGYEY